MPAPKKRKRGLHGLPFYRKDRDHWCVPRDPKKTPLRDENGEMVRGAHNQDKALAVWHDMMAVANAGRLKDDNEVKTVLELYLQDAERRISQKSFDNYRDWFQSFVGHWRGLLVRDLKPFHVHQWWGKAHPDWGASMQNLSGSALKAALNWAAKPGKGGAIIPHNPLDGMALPTMRKRSSEVNITQEEFDRLLGLIQSEPVRDILLVAWETGTRPVNLSRATKANVTADGYALLFADWNTDPDSSVHKTFKRTGRPLTVPLPAPAREIVARLAARYPEGPLFRSPRGLTWTAVRLANVILSYAKKAGLEGRFTAYSCRHSRATALLESGVSEGDVAAILGNTPAVIHRTYSHVASHTTRLVGQMESARKTTSRTETPPQQSGAAS